MNTFTKQAEITKSNGGLLPLGGFNCFEMTAVCIKSLSQCFRIYKNNYIFVIFFTYTQQTTAGLLSKEKNITEKLCYVSYVSERFSAFLLKTTVSLTMAPCVLIVNLLV